MLLFIIGRFRKIKINKYYYCYVEEALQGWLSCLLLFYICLFSNQNCVAQERAEKTPTCQKNNFESVNLFLPNFPLPSIIDYKS